MEKLLPHLRWLHDVYRSSPLGSRVLVGALVLLVSAASVYLVIQQQQSATEALFAGRTLSTGELDQIEAAFSTAGLTEWERTADRIEVPKQEKFAYIAALAEQKALPENSDEIFRETMQSSTFYESSQQRSMRIKYATQREAAMVVQAMSGIESATVRYVDVASKAFGAPKKTKANVAVRAVNNQSLTTEQVTAICDTVAYMLGADFEDVVVTDLTAVRAYRGNEIVRPDPQEDYRSVTQRSLEKRFRDEIQDTLSMIEGVVVNVRVRLAEPSEISQVPAAVTRQPELLDIASRSPRGDSSYGNTPLSIDPSGRAPRAEQHATPDANEKSDSTIRLASVNATVSIPKSHFYRIWQRQSTSAVRPVADSKSPYPTDDALAQLETTTQDNVRQLVLSCLPDIGQSTADPNIVVVTSHYDLNDSPIVPTQHVSVPFDVGRYRWEITGVICVCLVLAVVTWTLRAGRPARDVVTEERHTESLVSGSEPETVTSPLREELVQRVRQDPRQTAVTLTNWLRDAA